MKDCRFLFRNIVAAVFFVFLNSFLFSQHHTIDPELQRYFEKKYGYLKDEFRDTPISTISSDIKSEVIKKNSVITYNYLPQPDYTSIPLHYDIKKQNLSGSISYVILDLNKTDDKMIDTYSIIDITISSLKKSEVLKDLERYGFIFAGEESFLDDKSSVVVFGWIKDKNISLISKIKHIEKISFSKRDIKAPSVKVILRVKVPNNRDIVVFSNNFIKKISEYGFVKKGMSIISNDKKYRFSIINIEGEIPIDKTSILIKNPFVIEVGS